MTANSPRTQNSPSLPVVGDDDLTLPDAKRQRLNAPIPTPAAQLSPMISSFQSPRPLFNLQQQNPPGSMAPPPVPVRTVPNTTPHRVNPQPLIIGTQPLQEEKSLDVDTLNDPLAVSGVNLREEEEKLGASLLTPTTQSGSSIFWAMQGTSTALSGQTAQKDVILQDFLLRKQIDKIVARQHGLHTYDPNLSRILSLALTHHLQHLLSQFSIVSNHRTSTPLPPANDQNADLIALAREHRQLEEEWQEQKRRRKAGESLAAASAAIAAEDQGAVEGGKKRKRDRENISAAGSGMDKISSKGKGKEMTEEAQKRSTEITVNVMLGGSRKKYPWMISGSTTPRSPSVSSPSTPYGGMNTQLPGTSGAPARGPRSAAVIEEERLAGRMIGQAEKKGVITIKDALEALEMETIASRDECKDIWKAWVTGIRE